MRYVIVAVRLVFGAWMLWNGLNWFTQFEAQPTGIKSHDLHIAFMESGMFTAAKVTEIVAGVSALANRFVPLTLVISFPVTAIIGWMALLIEDPRPAGAILLTVHAALLLAYLRYYRPMLTFKAQAFSEEMSEEA